MSDSMDDAAATLVYYIKRIAAKAGVELNNKDHEELNATIAAFAEAEKALRASLNPNP